MRQMPKTTNPKRTLGPAKPSPPDVANRPKAQLLSAEQMRERSPVTKTLTSQQKHFVREVVKGESVLSAALRAGYSHGETGYQVIKVPAVEHAIAVGKAQFEADAQMNRKQVMEGFKEAIEMAKLMADPTAMISGWREIGRMCGYYAPVETKLKIDVTGNVTMTRLTQMSDAELIEMIEKGAKTPETPLLTDENDQPQPD